MQDEFNTKVNKIVVNYKYLGIEEFKRYINNKTKVIVIEDNNEV